MAQSILMPASDANDRNALAAGWLAGYSSPRTRQAYQLSLTQWFAFCDANALDPLEARRAALDVWMRQMEAVGLAAASRGLKIVAVRSWYSWLVEEEYLVRNPALKVRAPKRENAPQPALSRVHAGMLLEHARTVGGVRYAMVCLGFVNGLRVSEMCDLDVTDVGRDRYHETLTVHGKGQKVEMVPMPPVTATAVHAAIGTRDVGPVIVTAHGTRLTRSRAKSWLTKLCEDAGVPPVPPHALRRTAIQLLLAEGVPLREVQMFARHASSTTTAVYDSRLRSLDEHASYSMMRVVA